MLHRAHIVIRQLSRFFLLVVLTLLAVSAAFTVLVAAAATHRASAQSLTAAFDWSVPDRLVVDADGLVKNFVHADDVSPDAWPVHFDACASTGSIATYRWTVEGVPVGESAACDGFTHEFPSEGVYDVSLTVLSSDGTASPVVRRSVIVQDFLIVAMGDSYASGEGVPDQVIPQKAWDDLEAAGADLLAAQNDWNDAKDDLAAARNDLYLLKKDLQDAIAARILAQADLDDLLAQTNLIRDLRKDVIDAQAAVDQAVAHRDAACSFPPSGCAAAQAELTARQSELAAARAALTVELTKFGIEHLALNAIEAALVALEEPRVIALNAARSAEAAVQAAVDAAQATVDAAQARVEGAKALVDAAQASFDVSRETAKAEWGTTDEDRRCHRSSASGQVQAALLLEQNDPKTSVTLLHLACSGATINDGLIGFYNGVEGGPFNIDPQIIDASTYAGIREIDALVISIGGNDIKFSTLVETCIGEEPCFDPVDDAAYEAAQQAAVEEFCESISQFRFLPLAVIGYAGYLLCTYKLDPANTPSGNAATVFNGAFNQLDDRYRSLQFNIHHVWLRDLEPDRVYLTEYPDVTKDELGNYCGFDPADDAVSTQIQLPGITAPEFEWAAQVPLSKLNGAIHDAAQEHGWNVVGGIYDAFQTHGYCSSVGWVVRLQDSIMQQDDVNGTIHPTREGQNMYRDRILAALLDDLYIVPPGDPDSPAIPRAADGVLAVKSCPDAYPDLLLTDYDPRRAEFFTFENTGTLPVDLEGCHAATWDAIAEKVIWSDGLEGVVLPGDAFTVANSGGDFALPEKSMDRGPGGVTILGEPISVGASVQDALGSIVSSMVYIDASTVFGQDPAAAAAKSGGPSFEEALSAAGAAVPKAFALEQNYPNPFNPTTSIAFELPEEALVEIEIFDILGRRVSVLVDRELAAGRHSISWNAAGFASGTYIYRIRAGSFTASRRMMLLQ